MDNYKKYIHTLNNTPCLRPFYQASVMLLNKEPQKYRLDFKSHTIYRNSALVVGPALTSFILWLLDKATASNIKTLFFLARDGQIMKEIAEIFIDKYHLNVTCRYLYVSRYSLRKALYCIDAEDTLNYLCRDAINVTPLIIMKRTGLPENTQSQILTDLGYDTIEKQRKKLSLQDLKTFPNKLKKSALFCDEFRNFAHTENDKIFQYFKEQGLTTLNSFGIVDSGWTGSMQRSIRQILSFNKIDVILNGFYFGIQNIPHIEDGIYHSFYFTPQDIKKHILFNNNLFECWCMADHGMTIDYATAPSGIMQPLLKEKISFPRYSIQRSSIKEYVTTFVDIQEDFSKIPCDQLSKYLSPLLIRFMMWPDRDEAIAYGCIPFCDDPTENTVQPLAAKLTKTELLFNTTAVNIMSKIVIPPLSSLIKKSGWKEGSIALLPPPFSWILKVDCLISYIVKIFIANLISLKKVMQSGNK